MKLRIGTRAEWRAWFVGGGLWWVSLTLVLVGIAWSALMPSSQDTVRQLGLIYEVVGVMVVVVEIRKASGRDPREPLPTRLKKYWRAFPMLPRAIVQGASGVSVGLAGVSATGAVGAVRIGHPTVEQRLGFLEGRADVLEVAQATIRRDVDAEVIDRRAAVKDEADKRQEADAALDRKIIEVETGGLDLSLFGVIWLLVGMLMTTGTQELCRWVLGCR